MVRDYVAPALRAGRGVVRRGWSADDFAAARELAAWREQVVAAWPGVAVLHVESSLSGTGDAAGRRRADACGPRSRSAG